ncbi:MAG: STAS domain-containing protein [Prochloraceae cyanobacterium]
MKKNTLTVELSENYSANIIKLYGEILEIDHSEEIYRKLNRSIEEKVEVLILDLSKLKYIGNGGTKILEECHKIAKQNQIQLFITRPH